MGMDDHIQRLYPEDSIGAHSSYLIIRSYPEFTARRLAAARASATPDMVKNKFSAIYTVPDVDKSEKGDSETIGLWMFTTDSREPLFDVFSRSVAPRFANSLLLTLRQPTFLHKKECPLSPRIPIWSR